MNALLLCAAFALQDDPAKALETFQATWNKEKGSEARANAVTELSKTPHEKVCAKLSSLLSAEDKQVRLAAAQGLGTFRDPAELKKAASKALQSGLGAGANANDPDCKVAILNGIGSLQDESAATKVRDTFEEKDTKVATAAVTASGSLHNKIVIDPLIQLLRECEDQNKKAATPPPATGKAPKKTSGSGAPPANDPAQQKAERARALSGAALTALANLTGQSLKTSDEYQQWWSKNRSTFQPK